MLEVALATVVLGLIAVAAGGPAAALLRRASEGWAVLAVDALLLGAMLLAVTATLVAWWGAFGAAVCGVSWLGAAVAVVRRRKRLPAVRSARLLTRSDVLLAGSWLVVLGLAAYLRLHEVPFLPWLGDMGAYVNWAAEFARTGQLLAEWPPLFPAYLAVSALIFGPAHASIGVPLLGMTVVVAVPRVLDLLGVDRWVGLASGSAVALGAHAVWYSMFPASESMNALLVALLGWFLVRLVQGGTRVWPEAAGVGVAMFALVMNRGSGGLLLLPLAVVVGAGFAVPSWRPVAPRLLAGWFGAVVGAAAGFWYGVSAIQPYFVEIQLAGMLPSTVFRTAERAGLLAPSFQLAGALLAVIAVSGGLTAVARRRAAGGAERRLQGPWPAVATVVAATALVGALAVAAPSSETWEILERMQLALAVGAVVGTALVGFADRTDRQVLSVVLAMTASIFIVLHTGRLGPARPHSYFLFWDRYLVSEVLPAFLILTFLGVGGLAALVRARTSTVMRLSAVVVAALVVAPGWTQLRIATSDVFMRGADSLLGNLDAAAGASDEAIVWSVDDQTMGVPGYTFFPNTWMAFAAPLETVFGRTVLNTEQGLHDDMGPDDTFDVDDARQVVACLGLDHVVLMEVETGGPDAPERFAGSGLTVTRRDVVDGLMMIVGQPPGDQAWHAQPFEVKVWDVSLPDALADGTSCSNPKAFGTWP